MSLASLIITAMVVLTIGALIATTPHLAHLTPIRDVPMLAGLGLLGFQIGGTDQMLEVSMVERALREGGFFGIILILLYFYRRDTKWATEYWKDKAAEGLLIIRENTTAQTHLADALRENNIIVHQAKTVLSRLADRVPDRG